MIRWATHDHMEMSPRYKVPTLATVSRNPARTDRSGVGFILVGPRSSASQPGTRAAVPGPGFLVGDRVVLVTDGWSPHLEPEPDLIALGRPNG